MYSDRMCPGCMNDAGGEQICSICGYDMSSKNENFCLPVKFLLSERYVIGKAISTNVEGVTYIAWDNASDTAVHIKEYYPKDISTRNPDKTVSVVTGAEFNFNEGLLDFIDINKKLIATELQAMVPTLTVFEENGTAYAVMPIISSITLQSFLERNGGSLRWEQVRPLFLPVIDTLKDLHELGIIHGGISPESILVGRDGKLRINGICTRSIRKISSIMPYELYNGYSAVEQYAQANASLYETSDVYALSATLFRVLIGTVPPSADTRLSQDTLTIPSRFADELPRQVLVAIANGMQVKPQNRTRDIDTFKNELVYGETQESIRKNTNTHVVGRHTGVETASSQKKSKSSLKYAAISAGITGGLFLVAAIVVCVVFWESIFGTKDTGFNESNLASMPEIESVGDYDPNAAESVVLFKVPDLTGSYYHQLMDNETLEHFNIVIKGKEYSDEYERGMICAQSVAPDTAVEDDTEIQIVISLGPKEITVANVVGLDELNAKLELLKQGFLYDNIIVVEKYDSESKPGIVLEQDPVYGEPLSTEGIVHIYVNSYKGDDVTSTDDNEDSSDSSESDNTTSLE
ncbi:MAG: PASTA domain-containing protein [Clostridia bacterium]|nr:PASTA domain-containing protein [Clostridia bacterium]